MLMKRAYLGPIKLSTIGRMINPLYKPKITTRRNIYKKIIIPSNMYKSYILCIIKGEGRGAAAFIREF